MTSESAPPGKLPEPERVSSCEKDEQECSGPESALAGAGAVRLFPRRKAGEIQSKGFRGRAPAVISLKVLEQYFGRPQMKACQELEVSLATMKRLCRKFGIKRWPGPSAHQQHNSNSSSESRSARCSPDLTLNDSANHEKVNQTPGTMTDAGEQLRQLMWIASGQQQQSVAGTGLAHSATSTEIKPAITTQFDQAAAMPGSANMGGGTAVAYNPVLVSQLQAAQAQVPPTATLQNCNLTNVAPALRTEQLLVQQAQPAQAEPQQSAVYSQYLQALLAIATAQKTTLVPASQGFPAPASQALSMGDLGSLSRLSSNSTVESASRVPSLWTPTASTGSVPSGAVSPPRVDFNSLVSLAAVQQQKLGFNSSLPFVQQ